MFILIPLGIIILAGIIFLAVSRKSSLRVRIVALCALALMIITIIICLFLIFGVSTAAVQKLPQSEIITDAQPVPKSNNTPLILMIVFLLLLFFVILMMSIKEQKHSGNKVVKNEEGD